MNRGRNAPWYLLVVLLWLFLWLSSYLLRPLWPIDETRYVSVAWEMWESGNFLVPHLNGLPYPHKPPLLFWLIHLGWTVFGVNDWWPRLVPSIFGVLSLFLTAKVAKILWPEKKDLALMAAFVLMGFYLWAAFCTVVMFDLILSFFVLITVLGGLLVIGGNKSWGTLLMGAGLGLGILSKGPVVFIHSLPVLLLYPWWSGENKVSTKSICTCFGIAIALGIGLASLWAIPAAESGGQAYKRAILWGQTAHRVTSSFAHRRPWWWYLPWLPLFTCPWVLFLPSWRGILKGGPKSRDLGLRFCISWFIPALIVFSLLSGKQIYYLLPLLPAIALLVAWSLSGQSHSSRNSLLPYSIFLAVLGLVFLVSPIFIKSSYLNSVRLSIRVGGTTLIGLGAALFLFSGVTVFRSTVAFLVASILSLLIAESVMVKAIGPKYDLRKVATIIKIYENEGRPIAHCGKYHGQFHFLGRLKMPLQVINDTQIDSWLKEHPNGRVVAYFRHPPTSKRWKLLYCQPYRSGTLVIMGLETKGPKAVYRRDPGFTIPYFLSFLTTVE